MFSSARQIYVLEKGDNRSLKTGIVEFVSQPIPKYQTTYPYNGQVETTVDIKAKIGDESVEFKQLPSNQNVFCYNNVIVTDSREEMNAEIDRLLRESKAVIESVPFHEEAIKSYNQFIIDLNPQFAKDMKQEERISGIENRMGNIEASITSIENMVSSLLKK